MADDFDLALAEFSQSEGSAVSPDDFRAYLARFEMSATDYLANHARLKAITKACEEPPIPDPEKDPERYQHWQYMTYPMWGSEKGQNDVAVSE